MALYKPTVEDGIVVHDVEGMRQMSEDEYAGYVERGAIFFVDRHNVLREATTGRPIATTRAQVDFLKQKLDECWAQMPPEE